MKVPLDIILADKDLMPSAAYEEAAGLDLRIDRDLVLQPGQVEKVSTGVAVDIPAGYVGLVFPRSSCSGWALENTVGVIDRDYTGVIFAKLKNTSNEAVQFWRGDRILQLVLVPCLAVGLVNVVTDFNRNTARGAKGDGSSGVK